MTDRSVNQPLQPATQVAFLIIAGIIALVPASLQAATWTPITDSD